MKLLEIVAAMVVLVLAMELAKIPVKMDVMGVAICQIIK